MQPPSEVMPATALLATASGSAGSTSQPGCASGRPASGLLSLPPQATRPHRTRPHRTRPKRKQGPTTNGSRPARCTFEDRSAVILVRVAPPPVRMNAFSAYSSPQGMSSPHGISPHGFSSVASSPQGFISVSPHGLAAGVVEPLSLLPPQATRPIIPTARTAVRRKLICLLLQEFFF